MSTKKTQEPAPPPETKEPQEFVARKPAKKASVAKKNSPPPAPPKVMKTNIAARLAHAVDECKTTEQKRSADLIPLSQEYHTLRNRLRGLVLAMKIHLQAMQQVDKTQMEVIRQLSVLADKSPIEAGVGGVGDDKTFARVHQQMSESSRTYATLYQETLIDYVTEWEEVVTTRIDAELKECERLSSIMNHYHTKVENLRKEVNTAATKGKASPMRKTEKLTRNEQKLNKAYEEHEAYASKLAHLMEEATKCGWKDLYPLLLASINLDVQSARDANEILGKLDGVKSRLNEMAHDHKMDVPPPRPPVALSESSSMEDEEEREREEEEEKEQEESVSTKSVSTKSSHSSKGGVKDAPAAMSSPTAVANLEEDEYESAIEPVEEEGPAMPTLPEV